MSYLFPFPDQKLYKLKTKDEIIMANNMATCSLMLDIAIVMPEMVMTSKWPIEVRSEIQLV